MYCEFVNIFMVRYYDCTTSVFNESENMSLFFLLLKQYRLQQYSKLEHTICLHTIYIITLSLYILCVQDERRACTIIMRYFCPANISTLFGYLSIYIPIRTGEKLQSNTKLEINVVKACSADRLCTYVYRTLPTIHN